jgi:hypothetical protein
MYFIISGDQGYKTFINAWSYELSLYTNHYEDLI